MLKGRNVLLIIIYDEETKELVEKMHNVILLCLGTKVLRKFQKMMQLSSYS